MEQGPENGWPKNESFGGRVSRFIEKTQTQGGSGSGSEPSHLSADDYVAGLNLLYDIGSHNRVASSQKKQR